MVTDCILVQFSALTLFMLALFHRTARVFWLYAAAIAAGLATGTKYTGVFLLAPVLLASCLTLPFYEYLVQVRRAATLCLLAFIVYLVTTPGTVLDVFTFLKETHYISKYYLSSHGGFTAAGAWDHARIVASYFALAYFSPYLPLAAALFAGVVAGGVLSLKRDVRFGAVLVGFPLAFLVFFCIKFRVVMVRNWRAGSELHRSGPGLARAAARGRRAASTLRVSYQNREKSLVRVRLRQAARLLVARRSQPQRLRAGARDPAHRRAQQRRQGIPGGRASQRSVHRVAAAFQDRERALPAPSCPAQDDPAPGRSQRLSLSEDRLGRGVAL